MLRFGTLSLLLSLFNNLKIHGTYGYYGYVRIRQPSVGPRNANGTFTGSHYLVSQWVHAFNDFTVSTQLKYNLSIPALLSIGDGTACLQSFVDIG